MAIYPNSEEGLRRRGEFNDPMDAQARGLTRMAEGPDATQAQRWNNLLAGGKDGFMSLFSPGAYTGATDALRKERFSANEKALRDPRPSFADVQGKSGPTLQGDALRRATNKRIWDENADVRAQNGGIDPPDTRTGNENEVLGTFNGRAITRGDSDRMSAGSAPTGATRRGGYAPSYGQSVIGMRDSFDSPAPQGRLTGPREMSEHYAAREDREAIAKALSDMDSERFRLELVSQHGGGKGRRADAALAGLGAKRADLLGLQAGTTQAGAERRMKYDDSAADRVAKESQFGRDLGFKQDALDRGEAWEREKFGTERFDKYMERNAPPTAKELREADEYSLKRRSIRDNDDEAQAATLSAQILKANPQMSPADALKQANQALADMATSTGQKLDTQSRVAGGIATIDDFNSDMSQDADGMWSRLMAGRNPFANNPTLNRNFDPAELTVREYSAANPRNLLDAIIPGNVFDDAYVEGPKNETGLTTFRGLRDANAARDFEKRRDRAAAARRSMPDY